MRVNSETVNYPQMNEIIRETKANVHVFVQSVMPLPREVETNDGVNAR